MLTDKQNLEFKTQLKERFCDLREEIRLELLRSDDQHFIDLAGQVHDLEEESVADLLVDLNLAILDMHIEEIRGIDASLMQIAKGSYGVCIDCGIDIAIERLRANLTAQRCTPCQSAYERNHAGPEGHTL
jgi:RNA polymerase-binding transcription factor DksA